MAKKMILVSPVLVCAAVITALVLSGVGGARAEATAAELEQAKAKIVSLLEAGDMAGADAALDELLALADSEQKGRAVHEVAGEYKKVEDFDKTLWLSQYVVDRWPGADYAVWCEMEVALCNIELGNNTAAQSAVDKLSADYASDANQPWTLYLVGQRYDYGRMYDEARGVYEQVAALPTAGQWGQKAQLGAARVEIASLIDSGSWSLAVQELDLMLADFADRPDIAQSLAWLGERFGWARRYGEAKDVFDILIRDYPDSSFAQAAQLWSARMNACGLINQGKDEDALAAVDKLIEDFGSDAGLAEAVYWIGKEYEWKRGTVEDRTTRYEAPDSVYERLIQEFGETSFGQDAEWDKKRLEHRTQIFTLMKDGEPNEVEAAIAAMEADLAGRAELASELYWVGREYEEYPDKYGEAKAMFHRVITEYGESIEARQARVDIGRIDVQNMVLTQKLDSITPALESLEAAFDDKEYLGDTLTRVGTQLYELGEQFELRGEYDVAERYMRKAVEAWRGSVERYPESSLAAGACYFSAVCCRRYLGEYEKAISYYEEVLERWPDYEYAWHAQYSIGDCYEALMDVGAIAESEVLPRMRAAYRGVVEKYPDCRKAKGAALRLRELGY